MHKEAQSHDIAIIGMACVYPGAHSPEELWQNVLAGRRYFRKTPPERLPLSDYFDPDPEAPGKTYSDQMALITGWSFDPLKFRIPPVTAHASDIAHWIALSTAGAALADAQIDLSTINRERVGVILGNTLAGEFSRSHTLRFRWPYVERSLRRAMSRNRFPSGQIDAVVESMQAIYNAPLPEITEDSLPGNMSNTIAGRICNHFDFGGGGFTIDGACSSSLLSVLHACNALLQGDMDIALAGGVDISLDPFEIVGFAKSKALAVDDIRPYDERAAGMLPGEGCGIIVLVRGDYAREAGLPVRAFIKGYGYSSDGSGGITAPMVEGQMRALQRTYERSGYPISTVGLFEGHGTGTTLGDKIEIDALRRMIESSPDHGFCWLGTIKGNFGHCKAAAGIAGLIKSVMALKRKIIPPTMNCEQPNPLFGRPMGRLRPTVRGTIWPAGDIPRRASVSAMGFGGSNAHVTLEEANPEEQPSGEDMDLLGSYQKHELLLVSAESPEELKNKIEQLTRIADRISRAELTDLSAALSHAPQTGRLRLAIVSDAPWELAAALRHLMEKISEGAGIKALDAPEKGIFAGEPVKNPSCVALFPGQGSQFLNMGEYWFRRNPFVYSLFNKADKAIQDILPHGLKPYMLYNPFATDEESARGSGGLLRDTRIAQPAIVLSSIATLKVLNDLGLRPDTVIGHSLGEITALHAAGAMNDVTAIRIAALRGRAMASLKLDDPGGMAAVFASPEKVKTIIEPFQSSLTISNFNSPGQTVVSGTTPAIKEFVRLCGEQDITCQRLPVSHAFHSEVVAPAAESLRKALGGVTFEKMSSKVISTSTGTAIDDHTDLKSLLGDQIRKPVRLTEAVLEAAEQRPALWVEVGPKGVLTSLLREIMGDNTFECFTTDIAGEDGSRLLNSLIARAFVLGFPLVMDRLFANRFYRPFSIDNYNPSFIVNPCERPVHENDLPPVASHGGMPSALFPEELSNADSQGYLEDRSAFVRELISLDYHHYTRDGARSITREPAAVQAGPPRKIGVHAEEKPPDRESMMAFVIDWISRRTGYPTASISPEMKLRDDLNLDSIKAGELAIILSRKFGGTFTTDSASFANAPLSALIEGLQIGRAAPHGDTPDVKGEITLKQTGGLPDRIRTFIMAPFSAPFGLETKLPPLDGRVMIISRAEDPRAKAIADALKADGLIPVMAEGNGIAPDRLATSDITAAIIIAAEEDKPFFDCAPSEFERRVDGLASHLFIAFKTLLEDKGPGFRALVLRPVSSHDDAAMDLDAGAGFLKTLSLEYPGSHFKWVALPAEWTGGQWADTALQELQVSGNRVFYRYSHEGYRTTEAAMPSDNAGTSPQPLRSNDVVIVTGGAKGITFELCRGLARKTGVKLALFGSSPVPDDRTEAQDSEMLANFAALTGEGITFRYVQCDVTDEAAVRRAVRSIEKDLGPVTGILHGAGFSRLQLFRDMDLEAYLRCIRVKTLGLYYLITSIDPGRMKIIHVVSSILGKTGMKGQADYTFANAWMDYALSRLQKSYPEIHCLSLGYSVWAETGLGKKLGAVETLSSIGITPIGTVEGVSAYLNLTDRAQKGSTFVITGRMTPELEWNLFPPLEAVRGRFLEKLYRWIPGGEVVAEAVLSQASDLYLPEHVYQGTTIFPGVMAIEAMVEAAMLCTGRADLPSLRDIQFRRPLIVPEGSEVILRTQAVADLPEDDMISVRVIVTSDSVDFQENHFEAHCLFGEKAEDAAGEPLCPPLPEILPIDPESFNPSPLFQGKFFRRISALRKLEEGNESITDIAVPVGETYFSASLRKSVVTPSPAVRDAFLQSGALLLPPGYLPVKISELKFHHRLQEGASVVCHSRGTKQSKNTYVADISVFARDGKLIEILHGIVLERPLRQDPAVTRQAADSVPLGRLEQELKEHRAGIPHAIAIMEQDPAGKQLAGLITDAELERIHREVPAPRQKSASANLAAARLAAVRFAETHLGLTLSPLHIHLSSRTDGMPDLRFDKPSMADEFRGIGVSLSDSAGVSVALVGPAPLGVDIQVIETRDAEMWGALLGTDGYALARHLVSEAAEPFDRTATRVWTMIEAVKKANSLKLLLPDNPEAIRGPWISLRARQNGHTFYFLSTTVHAALDSGNALALTVVMDTEQQGARVHRNVAAADNASSKKEPGATSALQVEANLTEGPESIIDKTLSDMLSKLGQAEEICMDDPDNPSVEKHFSLFEKVFVNTMSVLRENEPLLPPQVVLEKKRWMYKLIRNYWGESVVFRRTLEKPLGYPGDHLLLDAMFHNKVDAKGIGYHFDRYFLSYPGTEGVRQRSYWVVERVESLLAEREMRHLTLLDLGCGPMAIEKTLLERAAPDRTFRFIGLDFDDRALNYAKSRLIDPRVDIQMKQQNLVSVEGVSEIRRNSADADVCICMGLIEYLEDETVEAIFDALYKGCDPGTRILTSNYQPDHYARPAMEWLLDWWLVYRTEPGLRRLALEAGFENSRIRTQLDPTGSIVLMEIER